MRGCEWTDHGMIWPSDDRWFLEISSTSWLMGVCLWCTFPTEHEVIKVTFSAVHAVHSLTLHGRLPTEPVSLRFYCATLCISTVFAIARCLPVRHVGVLYPDGWTYLQTFSWAGRPKILVFDPERWYPICRGTPSAGCLKYRGILRFSTEIAVYLGNGTRKAHCCYGTLIGSRMRSIEWWHFQWPWRTA